MDTVHECDRRTDGRTDRITITKTVRRIASQVKIKMMKKKHTSGDIRACSGNNKELPVIHEI